VLLPTLHHPYIPWISLDVETTIDPDKIPPDFNGWGAFKTASISFMLISHLTVPALQRELDHPGGQQP